MVFAKPVTDLTFDDIQALVDNEDPESITLEYKREIDRSPDGKKELAKDVSAMANSQGGYLIIGIAEEDHRPVMPERFVDRMLRQQKVEEWIEQVLNSNIAQRVSVQIKPIPVADQADECVVVIHIPQSPRVPHMVTTQGQKRYWVRHSFHTLPAEEYEVRDMFERGRRMRDEVERYLKRRGFPDPEDDPQFQFGMNSLTRKLGLTYVARTDKGAKRMVVRAHTIVSLVACPSVLGEWIDTSDDAFETWLDPSKRIYHPRGLFIPHEASRHTGAGLLCLNQIWLAEGDPPHPMERYLSVHRNGYLEYSYGEGRERQGLRPLDFVQLVGRFWQFLGFVKDIYQHVGLTGNAIVVLNLANVAGTCLGNLGEGWEFSREGPLEPHVQHVKEVDVHRLDDALIESIVREFATRVGNAFGQKDARCFNAKNGSFPMKKF